MRGILDELIHKERQARRWRRKLSQALVLDGAKRALMTARAEDYERDVAALRKTILTVLGLTAQRAETSADTVEKP